jgi:CHAT domain-containing protein/tetratricopeptide (TPR) repeat protein
LEAESNAHLEKTELARLVEQSSRGPNSVLHATAVHPHLAMCASCREQFEELSFLRETSLRGVSLHQGNCPGPAVWREIVGGLTPPVQTLEYIEHASHCDSCGLLLRSSFAELADLGRELTEEERKLIAALESAHPEWQQNLARRIAGVLQSRPNRDSRSWFQGWLAVPRLALAGACLLAVALGGMGMKMAITAHRSQPAAAERLLARAYSQKRTLELRIAGAEHAPLRVARGAATSFTNRPPALLKAEALIASQLQSHPSDPAWLQAQAQADMLEGRYDAAVEALRHALELTPHSPSLLIDLATSYYQRAQQEGRNEDFGLAYEYLSKALTLSPDNPVALFNRALVAEHQFLYYQALDDWNRYLQVDPRSDWATEAQDAAERLRIKLRDHDASRFSPLLSPTQIATSMHDQNLSSTVDPRIEDYLSEAIRVWLPQAYPEKAAPDTDAQSALFFLADLTRRQHNDRWLSDLLRSSSARNFPQAIAALAKAAQANNVGEYSTTSVQAAQAERLFHVSGNVAGTLRAQFEQIYAAQIDRHTEMCREKSAASLPESERHAYPWLQIQLGLENGICSGIMNDLGTQEKMSQRGADRAQKHGYGGLYLRSLYLAADEKVGAGDRPGAWGLSIAGLQRYWSSGQYPWKQAYNLYGGLAYDAENQEEFNLQVALWREAIASFGADANLLRRGTAHELFAGAAKAAHQPRLAEQQYAEAERLYALAPQNEASRTNAIENQVRRAQLESRQGQLENALGRLISVQDQVRSLSNNYVIQLFYSTLGELQLRRHRESEAEQALQPALALAEQTLASLGPEADHIKWKNDASPVYLALAEAKLLQGNPEGSLEIYERYLGASQGATLGHRSSQAAAPEPLPLAARLPLLSRETALVYAALPDGLAIWVCDDRGVHAEWIAKPTDELQELATRFYDLTSNPQSDLNALRRDGRSLYTSLILPVEQRLIPGRALLIEADGWLAHVPFEALIDAENHYLIERAPVVHSLGQDFDAWLRNNHVDNDAGPISAAMPALVVASTASSQDEGLPPLANIAAETGAVAGEFRSPRLLNGSEATLRAVQENLPSAAVFHFAGHSLATPYRSGLMLENTGPRTTIPSLLDAAAVRKLNVGNMQLAVLSACSTESGTGGSGGFNSITEALLRAGVPHVVASRWDVVEPRKFMDDFYRSALSGQLVSEAVRSASRNMLADPRTAHPYYWSAFAAYGRP